MAAAIPYLSAGQNTPRRLRPTFAVASLVRALQVVYRKRMRPAHELFARPGRSRCP